MAVPPIGKDQVTPGQVSPRQECVGRLRRIGWIAAGLCLVAALTSCTEPSSEPAGDSERPPASAPAENPEPVSEPPADPVPASRMGSEIDLDSLDERSRELLKALGYIK